MAASAEPDDTSHGTVSTHILVGRIPDSPKIVHLTCACLPHFLFLLFFCWVDPPQGVRQVEYVYDMILFNCTSQICTLGSFLSTAKKIGYGFFRLWVVGGEEKKKDEKKKNEERPGRPVVHFFQ